MAVLVLGASGEPLTARRRLALLVGTVLRCDATRSIGGPILSDLLVSCLLAGVYQRAHHRLVLQVLPLIVDCRGIQNIALNR